MVERANETKVDAEFSASEFRSVCGSFPTGVTVVTRRLQNGTVYGMTVSSFTSVSLDPPLILVCIDRKAGFVEALEPGTPFAVNVLSEDQQWLARRFSDHKERERFACVSWHAGWRGVPILDQISAAFRCSAHDIIPAGDHLVLIANVHGVLKFGTRPLVWCERRYHCLPSIELEGTT